MLVLVQAASAIAVKTLTIAERLPGHEDILIMKMDVEGHEPAAMRGAAGLFTARRVRNIVMEFSPQLTGVREAAEMLLFLHGHGFTEIYDLPYQEPGDYAMRKAPVRRLLDCSKPGWAKDFAQMINGTATTKPQARPTHQHRHQH